MMRNKNANAKQWSWRGWLLVVVLEGLSCALMGLVLIWSNIGRTNTAYFINMVQDDLRKQRELSAKLEVERERLLSPYELRRRAVEFGMHEPVSGQVRRIGRQ